MGGLWPGPLPPPKSGPGAVYCERIYYLLEEKLLILIIFDQKIVFNRSRPKGSLHDFSGHHNYSHHGLLDLQLFIMCQGETSKRNWRSYIN